jgi:hypothetical protein
MQRRRYAAVIDQSEQGQLLQVDGPEPTDEARGTKISVQIKEGDDGKFAQWIEDRARYWEPRPDVIGVDNFKFRDIVPLFKGDGWMIVQGGDSDGLALVDGIPYPVDRDSVVDYSTDDHEGPIQLAFQMGFVIHFATGDVKVTAPREGLEYDPGTIAEIRSRIEKMMSEVGDVVAADIENAGDLWAANRLFKALPDLPKKAVKDKANWNGIPVNGDFHLPQRLGFKVVTYTRSYKHGSDVGTASDTGGYFAFPKDNEPYYLLDEENIQRGRALYLFRTTNKEDVERIRVVVIPKGETPEAQKEIDEAYQKAQDEHGLRTLVESMDGFTSVEKWNHRKHGPKTSSGNGGPRAVGGPVIRVKTLHHTGHDGWKQSSVTLQDADQVFVQLFRGRPYAVEGKERRWTNRRVRDMARDLGVEVVGVQTPFIGKVPDSWVWLGDAVEAKYQEVIADPNYDAAMAIEAKDLHFCECFGSVDSLIDDGEIQIGENGLIDQWRIESERQAELQGLLEDIQGWAEKAGHYGEQVAKAGKRLKELKEALLAAAPALAAIESHWWTHNGSGAKNKETRKAMTAELQWYIDAKDPARDIGNDPQAAVDKQAYDLYKGNGGTLSYAKIEERLQGQPGIKMHNGNSARRAVKRHEKALGLVA